MSGDAGSAVVADLVHRRVRARAGLRSAWLEHLGFGPHITAEEVGARILDADRPEASEAWYRGHPALALVYAEGVALDQVLRSQPEWSAFDRFGWTAFEQDVAATLLAAAVDPGLERVLAWVEREERRGVTEALVAALFGHPRGAWLQERGALLGWQLVARDGSALVLDPWFRDRLLGRRRLDHRLAGLAGAVSAAPPLGWPVAELAEQVASAVDRGPVVVLLRGRRGSGRRTLARAVADQLGVPLLAVAVPDGPSSTVVRAAIRQAWADGAAVVWSGGRWACPPELEAAPVQFVCLDPGEPEPPISSRWTVRRYELPLPERRERADLWTRHLPASERWTADERERLLRPAVLPGEVARVGRLAPPAVESALAALRVGGGLDLGDLGQVVECPFGWDDLVLPAAVRAGLQDLAHEATDRAAFWEDPRARRLFPRGRGLLALFSGSPGTGKTMAAQVIAAGLGAALYRVDLSRIVSKYVGETSKNLAELLARTADQDVVVLFDEADALFGRRTEVRDAHDRYVNTDTNFLLQAIEEWSGVGVLATNRKSHLDPAFLRRIRHHLEFPRPDAEARRVIWERLVRELVGVDVAAGLASELRSIASQVELSGAQIKFAALSAVFRSRREGVPLDRRHLLHGVDREMDKEGRGLSDRERRRFGQGAADG